MFNNDRFKVTSMEKCILVSNEKRITNKIFDVYIPRLMPKITMSLPNEIDEPIDKSLIKNKIDDVEETITAANYLKCKSMTDYRTWMFGQIYKMSHSDSQTETEVVLEGAPGGKPLGPRNHDGEHMTGLSVIEKRDNEDLFVSKSYKDPLEINGISRPLSWSNSVKKQKHDHLSDSRGDGHPPQPHVPHAHPIKKPFQFFNVKYEELNNINITLGKEMIGTFVSGDLNDFRILHIPDVIPQDPDYGGSSPEDIEYGEVNVEIGKGNPNQGNYEISNRAMYNEQVSFETYEPLETAIENKSSTDPYENTKEESYDTSDPEYQKSDPGDPEPTTGEPEDEGGDFVMSDEIKTVAIDPGHGGSTIGASYNGLKEQDIVLEAGLVLKGELESRGYRVVMTRTRDVNVRLSQRAKIANNNNADIFVSMHINAATPSAHGSETLYNPASGISKQLAGYVQNEFVNNLPSPMNRNRGVKARDNLAVLNWSYSLGNMPAILTETGFISNPETNELLKQEETINTIAKNIADGIDNFKANHSA